MKNRIITGTCASLACAASTLAGTPQELFPDGFIDPFDGEDLIIAMLEEDESSAFSDSAVQNSGVGLGGERDASIGIFEDGFQSDNTTVWTTQNGRGTFESSSSSRGASGASGAGDAASLFLLYRTVADGTADFAPVTDDTPRADFSTISKESIMVDVVSVTGTVSLSSFIFTDTLGGGSGALDINPIIITEPGLVEIPLASFNTAFGTPNLEDVVNISFEFLTGAGGGITLDSIAVTGVPAPGAATLAALAGLATLRRRR